MKILSLFDGMACGHIAFNEFGRFQKILKIFLNPLDKSRLMCYNIYTILDGERLR